MSNNKVCINGFYGIYFKKLNFNIAINLILINFLRYAHMYGNYGKYILTSTIILTKYAAWLRYFLNLIKYELNNKQAGQLGQNIYLKNSSICRCSNSSLALFHNLINSDLAQRVALYNK